MSSDQQSYFGILEQSTKSVDTMKIDFSFYQDACKSACENSMSESSSGDNNHLFQAAIGHLQHGVILYDSDLNILAINDRVRELLELDESEFTVGDNFEKVVRINAERGGYGNTGTVEERFKWRMERARSFEPFHEDQLLFNGRHVEVYGQPVNNNGYVLTYTDITDRIHAEEAKNRFLAKMSHDLRTPINGVLSMTELLEFSQLGTSQQRMVTTIMRSSRVLLRLIDDILDLSKIKSGELDLHEEAFNLNDVMGDVVTTLQVIATKHNAHIELQISPEIPEVLRGDPVRIAQCVMNLLGNAIKYSTLDQRQGTINQIKITVGRSEEGRYAIEVSDEGVGIEETQIEKMFQPFVQGQQTQYAQGEGTGLGLSIVAELVGLMKGEIRVASKPGQGSIFTIVLPLVAANALTQQPSQAVEPDPAIASEDKLHGKKVLVVEDNPDNREALKMQLDVLGCRVKVAINGEHGLQLWRDGDYDLILSDWNMPVLDGLEMVKIIREEERKTESQQIPVIGITGNAMPWETERCLESGMNDYLTKPIRIADLKGKLEQFVNGNCH